MPYSLKKKATVWKAEYIPMTVRIHLGQGKNSFLEYRNNNKTATVWVLKEMFLGGGNFLQGMKNPNYLFSFLRHPSLETRLRAAYNDQQCNLQFILKNLKCHNKNGITVQVTSQAREMDKATPLSRVIKIRQVFLRSLDQFWRDCNRNLYLTPSKLFFCFLYWKQNVFCPCKCSKLENMHFATYFPTIL